MSQESDIAGPLTVWIARLQSKVDALEKESRATGEIKKLLKELDTCDTYWKKLYVRAKDFIFPGSPDSQIAFDLAHIKEQLMTIRGMLFRRDPLRPFQWEHWPHFS